MDALREQSDVECIEQGDGEISVRVHGLEFARSTPRGVFFGLETKRVVTASNLAEVQRTARLLAEMRSPGASDRHSALFLRNPESWLESQVRLNLEVIDATLWPEPVYGQVPAVTGCVRGVIDLLALGRQGRIAVIEVKAVEDPHLPLQALDYWMRVAWHAQRNEFAQRGYFPARTVSTELPKLILIAPALQFHPTTETVLRFFSTAIEVERFGVGVEWQKRLQVVFRARGASRPG